MKLYESIFFVIITIIAWPIIYAFFRAIGFQITSMLMQNKGYPVRYRNKNGIEITYFLKTAKDVIEFTDNPKRYLNTHKDLT